MGIDDLIKLLYIYNGSLNSEDVEYIYCIITEVINIKGA